MKIKIHIGNVAIILNGALGKPETSLLLGLKRPKNKSDSKRKRRRIGIGCWVPPGGATKRSDKSQKHAVQREVLEETGLFFPLQSFRKAGVLRGYIDSPTVPKWLVHIYLIIDLSGQTVVPNKKEYVKMRRFPLLNLPFKKMLQGDREWLPRIARGEKLSIRIRANENTDRAFSIDIRPVRFRAT